MAGEAFQEWLNRNAHRAFPFEEDSDFSCEGGSSLPLGLFLDARACMFGPPGDRDVRLERVSVSGGSVSAELSCGGEPVAVSCSGGHAVTVSGDVSVRVTFCGGDALSGMSGEYRLSRPPRLLPCRVLSIPYGIGVDTLSCGGEPATGTVRVADGHNTELDVHDNNLRLRIGAGLGKGRICPDPSEEACDGAVLYYLNGQKADSDGSLWIHGSDGVLATTGTYRGIPAVLVSTSALINSFMYR